MKPKSDVPRHDGLISRKQRRRLARCKVDNTPYHVGINHKEKKEKGKEEEEKKRRKKKKKKKKRKKKKKKKKRLMMT